MLMSMAEKMADWSLSGAFRTTEYHQDIAKRALLDGLGCMVAGAGEKPTLDMLGTVQQTHGAGDCSVIGHNEVTLPPAAAALVNGTAAHALDFDDNFLPGLTHATAVLLPALMAAATGQQISGRRFIDAYIAGLEFQARVSSHINPAHYGAGWHGTSTIGTIGTAGAIAWMRGGNTAQITTAMSIAFSLAAGSKLQFGTDVKPVHAGFAAHNAVLAAISAMSGLSAQPEFIEEKWGLKDLYAPGAAENTEGVFRQERGDQLAIEEFGLHAKRFPCCGASHQALEGIEALMEQYELNAEQIKKVTAILPSPLFKNLRFDRPETVNEARFSFSYPAAKFVKHGLVSLSHFTKEEVLDPAAQAQLGKFIREEDETAGAAPGSPITVKIETVSGEVLKREVTEIKGSNQKPFSDLDMQKKLEDCSRWAGNSSMTETFRKFSDLENFADISSVI